MGAYGRILDIFVQLTEALRPGGGLVPRYPVQKPPSRGLEGSGGERGVFSVFTLLGNP